MWRVKRGELGCCVYLVRQLLFHEQKFLRGTVDLRCPRSYCLRTALRGETKCPATMPARKSKRCPVERTGQRVNHTDPVDGLQRGDGLESIIQQELRGAQPMKCYHGDSSPPHFFLRRRLHDCLPEASSEVEGLAPILCFS